ncbi:unnamed protein product [Candidula unifasciata]|uniref:RNA-binding motif protein, X-linked 2 n=1 Tax=Candidula unifasciata TaxID=100452 RepID=A0A8S3Z411_9EUPU|nr:unnamed protein product [Candidula unifasciata]
MNPLTIVKNIQKLNDRELELGIIGKKSWHDEYKDSAWVYIGGLPFDLTEGDVICVFSQYGEVVNLNLIRDHKTGKIKGYGFLCYEDQRSTVLAVDNLNGIKILGRTIRVDHVKDYKIPKEFGDEDAVTLKIRNEGCAPQLDLPGEAEVKEETSDEENARKSKKQKKKKKKKKQRKMDVSSASSLSDSDDNDFKESPHSVEVKKERFDEGYNKALKKESVFKSDSSDSDHSSRDKTYRNGRDRYKYRDSTDTRDKNDSSRDRSDSRRDRNNSSRDKNNSSRNRSDGSRDRNDSSGDRNDSSKDRKGSSRDRNDSSRDRNEDSRDRHDGGRDRNNRSRDWNERRTDRNDISGDRERSSRGRNDSSRDRNDSRGERDSSYSQDRYTNNGLQSQDSRFYSSSSSRGGSRQYDNHSTRGRFSDRGGDRYYDRGRGRGGRGVRGNFRGQNTFFDDRERRYY